jgi:hypothetical protein
MSHAVSRYTVLLYVYSGVQGFWNLGVCNSKVGCDRAKKRGYDVLEGRKRGWKGIGTP